MEYVVIVDTAQVFRWNGSEIKAKVGALLRDTIVTAEPNGIYAIIHYSLFREEPPLAMYLANLSPLAPTPEPDPTAPDTLELAAHVVTIAGVDYDHPAVTLRKV